MSQEPRYRCKDDIKIYVKKRWVGVELDIAALGYEPMTGCCDHYYNPCHFRKGSIYIEQLKDCLLLK
jgi:hypothetical protein